MFCKKCGAKNEKDAKFCEKCGEQLTEQKETEEKTPKNMANSTSELNQGGLRKAIKADAKGKVKGGLIGATAIYIVAAGVIGGIFGAIGGADSSTSANTLTISAGISDILIALLALVFTMGITMVGFDAIRNKEYKWTDVFTKPFNHIDRLGYLLLGFVLIAVICGIAAVLMLIPILGFLIFIAYIIALIYYTPTISIFVLMLADVEKNQKIDFGETIKKSLEISKGNRVEFYGIMFSFIGWNLLAILTCGILYIWLTPYMELSLINAYRKWIGEETFEITETGLSNGTVIGLTTGGVGCGCIVVFVFFIGIIAAIITAVGINKDNPDIQAFIDKYVPAEDKADVESGLNEIFDEYQNEYNR